MTAHAQQLTKMTTSLTTDVILRQLNAEYQYSKAEQIRRFLLDQDNLKRTFSVYTSSASDGVSDEVESSDSGATELAFEERMSVYKVRPTSAYQGTSRLTPSDNEVDVDTPERTDAHVEGRRPNTNMVDQAVYESVQQKEAPPSRQMVADRRVGYGDGQRLLKRRGARPRTATGVRTTGGRKDPLQGLRIEGVAPRGTATPEKAERKQRSSAPATLSRSRYFSRDIDETERRGVRDGTAVAGLELPSCVPDGVTTVDPTEPRRLACHTSRWSKQAADPDASRQSDLLVVGAATARPLDGDWHPATSRKPSRQLHKLHVPDGITSGAFGAPSKGKLAVLKLPPLETVGVTQGINRQKTVVKPGAKANGPAPHQFLAG